MSNTKNNINRRNFLKVLGGTAAATTVALTGCESDKKFDPTGAPIGDLPKDKMTFRTNPTTGDKVAILGYGCMRWPTRPKANGTGEEIDQETVNELIDFAIDHGVNYFDTSPRYVQGLSEVATGIALKRHPRNKFLIATKLSTHPDDRELRSREGSLKMYHKSLTDLQIEYFDYYLIHNVGMAKLVPPTEGKSSNNGGLDAIKERIHDNGMLDFLLAERTAGRIRNLGWSFHGDIEVFDYLLKLHDEGTVKWDFIQTQLNYVDWKYATGYNTAAEYLYTELDKRGISVIAMEPLLGGRLSNLPQSLGTRLKQRRPNDSVASWAFRYAGSFPRVLTVLSGMTYMEHLQDNIRTYSPLEEITDEERELLADTARLMIEYPTVPCTTCQYCMPCPYGINIPAVFTHYNKCINEGNIANSSQDENYREARRAFLVGYDRTVPKLRQANHCIGCDQCVHHCPQAIKIPQELARIDKYVEELKQGKI